MSAAVLTIGTEITRGEIVDTNAAWLAEELTGLGLEVTALESVDDDLGRLVGTLRRLAREHQLVAISGGLGPTTDDLTRDAAAAAAGVDLELHEPSRAHIEALLTRRGRPMAASNGRQALLPKGARVLANPIGTAPGFALELHGCQLVFLPGVPRELKSMAREHLFPLASEGLLETVLQRRINCFGLPESAVNDRLAGIEAKHGVLVGYRAHFPEIIVKVLAKGADHAVLQARVDAATDDVVGQLGDDVVFGEGEIGFPQAVGKLLIERQLTLATAESCTGGMVAELLTEAAGASAFFQGSAVVYANAAKRDVLGVAQDLLQAEGAVSEAVARAMAEGARRRLGASVALAITGIAGPDGATETKPLGLVHFAVAMESETRAHHAVLPGSRSMVRRRAAYLGLDLVRRAVRGRPFAAL